MNIHYMNIQELIDLLVAARDEYGIIPCVYEGCGSLSPSVVDGKDGKVMDLVSGR